MLRTIENLPSHVTGIHAYGEVTEQQYITLIRNLLDEQVKKTGRINFILILETDIKNFASGMWCGNVRMGLKYFFRWKKIAILSDQRALTGYSDLFRYIIPGKFRNFRLREMSEALIWVSGK